MYSSFSFLIFTGVHMWKDTNIMLLWSVWDRGSCSMNQGLYCTKSLTLHHKIHLLIYSLILDHYVRSRNLNSTSTGSTIVVSVQGRDRGLTKLSSNGQHMASFQAGKQNCIYYTFTSRSLPF